MNVVDYVISYGFFVGVALVALGLFALLWVALVRAPDDRDPPSPPSGRHRFTGSRK